MSKHTPTPYRQNGLTVETKNGMSLRIATISPPGAIHGYAAKTLDESNANAEFIVTACNAYDDNQQTIAAQSRQLERLKERQKIEHQLFRKEIHDLRRAYSDIWKYADTLERAKSLAEESLKENDANCHNRLKILDEFDAREALQPQEAANV